MSSFIELFVCSINNPNTRKAYKIDCEEFLSWFGKEAVEATKADFQNYQAWLFASDLSKQTYNRKIAAIKRFYAWLDARLDTELSAKLVVLKAEKINRPIPELLTTRQLNKLLKQPDQSKPEGRRDLVWIRLTLDTGCRLTELLDLKWSQINFEDNSVKVLGKGSKERFVFFTEETAQALRRLNISSAYSKPSDYIFQGAEGRRISDRGIQKKLREYGEAIGRPDLHPHLLRHQAGTTLYNETDGDLLFVKTVLGHANFKTTEIYVHLGKERLKAKYDKAKKEKNVGETETSRYVTSGS